MTTIEWLFWALLILGLYPYVGYPCLAWAVSRLTSNAIRKNLQETDRLPTVCIVIAAHNEREHIAVTVENKLAQDYPADKFNIIVVSDGSADGTDEIVRRIATINPKVQLIRQEPRAGKTSALNLALATCTADIVVFSDANSIYRFDALRALIRNFADPKVGYVTGSMRYVAADGSMVGDGCSAFMRLENWLRKTETQIGSVVGVDGGIDAVRRDLYRSMRADQLPDFVLPLTVVQQGYRVVYEEDAILQESALTTTGSEYRMRVRVALRAFWALRDRAALFNPFRFGVFSWQLLSHKLLRYMSFVPLAGAALACAILAIDGAVYALFGAILIGAICLVALSNGFSEHSGIALTRYFAYFALLNIASAVAFAKFLRGEKQIIWKPREG